MRVNIMEETFENVTVFDQPMLFTCLRCDRETLPKGIYMYEVRHDDEGRQSVNTRYSGTVCRSFSGNIDGADSFL